MSRWRRFSTSAGFITRQLSFAARTIVSAASSISARLTLSGVNLFSAPPPYSCAMIVPSAETVRYAAYSKPHPQPNMPWNGAFELYTRSIFGSKPPSYTISVYPMKKLPFFKLTLADATPAQRMSRADAKSEYMRIGNSSKGDYSFFLASKDTVAVDQFAVVNS